MVEISEHDLNPLINTFNEGVCYLNAQGELLYYNKMAQAHWGGDLLPTNKLTSQPPVERALAGEQAYHELVRLDEQRTLLVSAMPLHAGANAVTGVVIISQNVSEHVLLEQQAHVALNMLLQAVIDTNGIEDIDEALRRVAALIPQLDPVDNSIAFRLDDTTGRLIPVAHFGSSSQSYEEWHSELAQLELSAESVLKSSSPAYMQALRLARPLVFDFSSATSHSNPRSLRAAIYAPVLLHGRVIGMLGAERQRPLEDTAIYFPQWSIDLLAALARLASMSIEKAALLTSVEHLQDQVATAHTLLNQKEEFLLLTAHELKNPLTAIRGQAQVLRRRISQFMHSQADISQNAHDLLKGLESIDHQTRRIERLINTLLEVSRVELDRLELDLQEVDLTQMARSIFQGYLPLAPNHELHLFVNGEAVLEDTPINASIRVQGDEQRLEQVLMNLISNAIKYSPEGGSITVSLRYTDDRYVELTVEDRGIGIPVQEQARLTERFYRAANAQGSSTQGLGVGLYLVNALVAKHGGSLSIKSEGIPGKGSIFSIKLPSSPVSPTEPT